ncbi:MAG: ATP-dependent RecD-like DNA helicase [Candidatus Izemoplasmatales bacterium]|jgi:exodeoxyribonuclease V alpha subunit
MTYIEGTIKNHLFYNEESSYSVLRLEILDTDDKEIIRYEPTIIVCGFFPRLDQHKTYRFYGEVKEHPKYGIQYQATRFESVVEQTTSGLVEYLASDLFKGVGPKLAQAIVDQLGNTALEKIANDKHVLDTIPRLGAKKRDQIQKTIIENRAAEKAMVWLFGFQISPKMAIKIYDRFGFAAIEIVKENPYVLMDTIEMVGFKRADEIAFRIGFSYDHPYRIRAVILYLLSEYMNKYGDTYVPLDKMIEYALSYLNAGRDLRVDESVIHNELMYLVDSEKIIDQDGRISYRSMYDAELTIARTIRDHSRLGGERLLETDVEGYLDTFAKARGIVYTNKQYLAIKKALMEHLVIITGGPGTGKTTIIDGIAHIYQMMHPNDKMLSEKIKLAAPTGKAAKRLQEATGLEATTIHRLLGYDYEGNFAFGLHNKIDARLIVLDEVSMLDTLLCHQFFQALSPRTKLVLVGDENQLPSVGPGQILADLIKADIFTHVRLDHIHRQATGSKIISLAYDVLDQNAANLDYSLSGDVLFEPSRDTLIADCILKNVKEAIDEGYNLHEDIQVVVPVYKGINGIDRLNTLMQERFNHHHQAHKISHGEKCFYFNDKVMQLVNQPEDGIMNGDIGIVTGIIEDKELLVDFGGKQVKYNVNDFDNLTLAYAISIHKSQGSEFKVVILPLARSHQMMLRRKLLYTAITRAKEKLVMVGEWGALVRGIHGYDPERKTWLMEFLFTEDDQGDRHFTIEDFL